MFFGSTPRLQKLNILIVIKIPADCKLDEIQIYTFLEHS